MGTNSWVCVWGGGDRVTKSSVFCVVFCTSLFVLSVCPFFFWPLHCLSFYSTYGFWLPLWILQTFHSISLPYACITI